MQKAVVRCEIIELLESQGCIIPKTENDEDLSIVDYIADSLMYMLFLISVEEHFEIEIPDECLSYEFATSLNGFTSAVFSLLENKKTGKDVFK